MSRKIFVNLAVDDLNRAVTFFTALGFTFNAQFTDETATCMIISDDIYAMLLTPAKFDSFAPKARCDTQQSNEVLIALSYDSREEVIDLVEKAVAAGGSIYADPTDHGFMYQHGFQDPDGHIWEIFYMDPSFVQ